MNTKTAMNEPTDIALLPCPFCGDPPEVWPHAIRCPHCNYSLFIPYTHERTEAAVVKLHEMWNTRSCPESRCEKCGKPVTSIVAMDEPHENVLCSCRSDDYWVVYHPDGASAGLSPRRFDTRKEAESKCREWNQSCPGHVILSLDSGACKWYLPNRIAGNEHKGLT